MFGLLFASLLAPFFVELTPEIRTTYVSLGKIMEDRPMQVLLLRAGYDTGSFGRFGFYNFDVSSLSDRRADVHRHFLYHTEYGLFWDCDWRLAKGWTLRSGLLATVTLYRGFEKDSSNGDYGWIQFLLSLENPYAVPYCRLRRYGLDADYFYFRLGLRRKFALPGGFYVMPDVYADGGNARNYRRVFGENLKGGDWGWGGVMTLTCRLEAGWEVRKGLSVFAAVEQYAVLGEDARDTNAASSNPCAHNDWTSGSVGLRLRF